LGYNYCMQSDTQEGETTLPCSDKLAFDTRLQAQATATTAAYQHGSKVTPYKCAHCQLWHLASTYS
jgi:predicted ATPase